VDILTKSNLTKKRIKRLHQSLSVQFILELPFFIWGTHYLMDSPRGGWVIGLIGIAGSLKTIHKKRKRLKVAETGEIKTVTVSEDSVRTNYGHRIIVSYVYDNKTHTISKFDAESFQSLPKKDEKIDIWVNAQYANTHVLYHHHEGNKNAKLCYYKELLSILREGLIIIGLAIVIIIIALFAGVVTG